MSDSIQYGSFRNPLYRDYEKFPYGTLENTLNSPPKTGGGMQQQQKQRNQTAASGQGKSGKSGKSTRDSCPFCKEQKKRPLGAYMRKRGARITTESISEDAEECAEELREDEGAELQDDFESGSSPSGSPSAAELGGTDRQHNHHHHHSHGHGSYGRQESQDSGCEAK